MRRPLFRLIHESGEPIEKRSLALKDLCTRRWQVEPLGTIDLGKTPHPSTFRRPLHFESVASYGQDVDIAFDSECDHQLAATLSDFAERIKQTREGDASLLQEFSARSNFGVLAFIQLALGN
ncbi:hypothetical protein ABIE49_004110 [Bradyrhizobium sp. OAE829]